MENKKRNKILKIIQWIYNIVSFGFIIFVSVALAIAPRSSASHNSQDQQTIEIMKQNIRKNIISGETRSVSFSNDILSSNFLATVCIATDIIPIYNNDPSQTSRVISVGDGFSGVNPTYPRIGNWNKIEYSNNTLNGTEDSDYCYLDNILVNVLDSGNSYGLRYYGLTFHFRDSLDDDIFHFTTTLFLKGNSLDLTNFGFSFAIYNIVIDNHAIGTGNFGIVYSNEGTFANLLKAFSNESYQQGFDTGRNIGYQQGFVDGAQGVETNAFTALTQAFEAVSSIFNIEVLPSLPLWVLVFAPVIVAAIIVIVKMIKG